MFFPTIDLKFLLVVLLFERITSSIVFMCEPSSFNVVFFSSSIQLTYCMDFLKRTHTHIKHQLGHMLEITVNSCFLLTSLKYLSSVVLLPLG